MKLQRLHIKNFKSIVDLEIVEPNPFTVFVGPNGSGKSNIFEALEFVSNDLGLNWDIIERLFGGENSFLPFKSKNVFEAKIDFGICFTLTGKQEIHRKEQNHLVYRTFFFNSNDNQLVNGIFKEHVEDAIDPKYDIYYGPIYEQFFYNFSRVFVKNFDKQKFKFDDNFKLNSSASNLEKVLKRILQDEIKREEIKEWLDLFIPGFENIEIVSSELSSTDTLVMYEKGIKKPFTKDLLSDGTYNILALLTAIYQSDEPQFLCIEEPENGLTPYVIEQFVELFRNACQEKGHYIWLNTHSPTLVRHLRADELIVVDKKQGATQIKQFKGKDFFGLRMDEAWLTNALGGGLPW